MSLSRALRPRFSTLSIRQTQTRNMHILPIPMWVGGSNNYAYLITDAPTRESVIVDPAHPSEVIPVIKSSLASGAIKSLKSIITTHHHWDHAGGNKEMLEKLKDIKTVIGGKDCDAVTQTPPDKSTFQIGENITVTALHTPCHTKDSICYYLEDDKSNENQVGESPPGKFVRRAVLTGDTLFIGGCGKFFEGTASQMQVALNETLSALPDSTIVLPGHEYTKSNVKFLEKVDPDNQQVLSLKRFAEENEVTTGQTTLRQEKEWNVFMRTGEAGVKKLTGKDEPSEVMAKLREMKNSM